jgi:hypothetical protein
VSDWRPKLVFKLGFRGHVALNLQEKTPRVLDFVTQLSVLAEPFDPILAIGLQRIPQWLCQATNSTAHSWFSPILAKSFRITAIRILAKLVSSTLRRGRGIAWMSSLALRI